jgi:hypothetical protein
MTVLGRMKWSETSELRMKWAVQAASRVQRLTTTNHGLQLAARMCAIDMENGHLSGYLGVYGYQSGYGSFSVT